MSSEREASRAHRMSEGNRWDEKGRSGASERKDRRLFFLLKIGAWMR